jgi:hypothetical protein
MSWDNIDLALFYDYGSFAATTIDQNVMFSSFSERNEKVVKNEGKES